MVRRRKMSRCSNSAKFCFIRFVSFVVILVAIFIFVVTLQDIDCESKYSLSSLERYRIRTMQHCEAINLGCFSFKPDIQSAYSLPFNYMTTDWCLSFCSSNGKRYAGLYRGSRCTCANDVLHFVYLKNEQCNILCSGNFNETCGGGRGVEVYRVVSSCVKGAMVRKNFGESRFLGCFAQVAEFKIGPLYSYKRNLTSTVCVLFCGMEKLPLALLDKKNGCMCGQMSERFNLTHKHSACDSDHLRVYRTLAEDTRCSRLSFYPNRKPSSVAVLATFPGSGNTWARYLLEQATGIYTGSIYGDKSLHAEGFLGELPTVGHARTLIWKDHMLKQSSMQRYKAAILIVRNPYEAIIADFHRYHSKGNHTGVAEEKAFFSNDFRRHFMNLLPKWYKLINWVFEGRKPLLLVFFDDLVNNTIAETKKMAIFLASMNNITISNIGQKLHCLSQQITGHDKRQKKQLKKDPFTKEMKQKLNYEILRARKLLMDYGFETELPFYERDL